MPNAINTLAPTVQDHSAKRAKGDAPHESEEVMDEQGAVAPIPTDDDFELYLQHTHKEDLALEYKQDLVASQARGVKSFSSKRTMAKNMKTYFKKYPEDFWRRLAAGPADAQTAYEDALKACDRAKAVLIAQYNSIGNGGEASTIDCGNTSKRKRAAPPENVDEDDEEASKTGLGPVRPEPIITAQLNVFRQGGIAPAQLNVVHQALNTQEDRTFVQPVLNTQEERTAVRPDGVGQEDRTAIRAEGIGQEDRTAVRRESPVHARFNGGPSRGHRYDRVQHRQSRGHYGGGPQYRPSRGYGPGGGQQHWYRGHGRDRWSR